MVVWHPPDASTLSALGLNKDAPALAVGLPHRYIHQAHSVELREEPNAHKLRRPKVSWLAIVPGLLQSVPIQFLRLGEQFSITHLHQCLHTSLDIVRLLVNLEIARLWVVVGKHMVPPYYQDDGIAPLLWPTPPIRGSVGVFARAPVVDGESKVHVLVEELQEPDRRPVLNGGAVGCLRVGCSAPSAVALNSGNIYKKVRSRCVASVVHLVASIAFGKFTGKLPLYVPPFHNAFLMTSTGLGFFKNCCIPLT